MFANKTMPIKSEFCQEPVYNDKMGTLDIFDYQTANAAGISPVL